MKTALLHFVFDVAAALFTHIAQHLGEHPLQRVVAHHAARGAVGILNRLIAVITDVEGGAVEMAGVLGGIAVAPAELHHIVLRAQHARDDEFMEGHTFHVEAVEERLTDILQKHGGPGHQIRNAGVERIDVIIRIGTHIDELTLARLGIGAILYRRDAPPIGCHQLNGIRIGESRRITGNGAYPVASGLLRGALGLRLKALDGFPGAIRAAIGLGDRRKGQAYAGQ